MPAELSHEIDSHLLNFSVFIELLKLKSGVSIKSTVGKGDEFQTEEHNTLKCIHMQAKLQKLSSTVLDRFALVVELLYNKLKGTF